MDHKPANSRDQGVSFKQDIQFLRKHARLVYLGALFIAGMSIVVVCLLPNQYKASTTILVDPQKIPERYVASTVTSNPSEHLNTLTQQVLSSSRIQEIVEQLNLYPELRRKKSREEVLDYIRTKIKIELKQSSEQGLSSFSISYVDPNRWLVAPVANQLASRFIEWNLKSRQNQALVTTQFLSNELEQAQKSLQEQEAALQSFRIQHVGATPDQLDGNLQAVSRLQAEAQSNMDAIARLDEERILMTQAKPSETRALSTLSDRDRLTLERNRLESDLLTLRRQYTDTYPDVVSVKQQLSNIKSQLNALPAPAPGSLEGYDASTQLRLNLINKEIDRHKQQLASLQQHIGSYQSKIQSVPVLETQLSELTRNYETSKQNYQSLLDKRLSAGMSEDLERKQQSERFTVLDAARTPEKPFLPKRIPFLAGAIGLGLILSTGAFVAFNRLRGVISGEAELISMLPPKTMILGTIPPIVSQGDVHRSRVLTLQTAIISALACAFLIAFFLKVRPIL